MVRNWFLFWVTNPIIFRIFAPRVTNLAK